MTGEGEKTTEITRRQLALKDIYSSLSVEDREENG